MKYPVHFSWQFKAIGQASCPKRLMFWQGIAQMFGLPRFLFCKSLLWSGRTSPWSDLTQTGPSGPTFLPLRTQAPQLWTPSLCEGGLEGVPPTSCQDKSSPERRFGTPPMQKHLFLATLVIESIYSGLGFAEHCHTINTLFVGPLDSRIPPHFVCHSFKQ